MSSSPSNALDLRFTHDAPLANWLGGAVRADIDGAKLSKLFHAFYRVRPFLPIFVRQILQRARNGNQALPANWFFPTELMAELESLDKALLSMWPDDADYALVLTHDVETGDGMKLIPAIAKIEEELGFRSAWNLVPYKYKIDKGFVQELRDRGHEIGIHGYNHDGRLFSSRGVFEKRLKYINQAIQDYDAVGFRTPMVHRNLNWMQGLEVEYDASVFDVDPLQAMPGGVQTVWPFICGKFVELPYTLPQDHTLLVTLGETTDRIWRQKLEWIRSIHGMALMVTHPDYLETPSKQKVYQSFLTHVRESGGYATFLPREIARFTRQQLGSD
jgi:peptidoglycan/xylan/chitin deacetylase (PgdA/CDA1 family)